MFSKKSHFYISQWLSSYGKFSEIVHHRKFAEDILHLDLNAIHFKHDSIPIAVMFDSFLPLEKYSTIIKYLVKSGFKTFKFKIGNNLNLEERFLKDIRFLVGMEINIRLDANRALDLKDAIHFGKKIAHLKIEYFEEPLKNPLDIIFFYKATGIPVALDETLIEYAHKNCPILEGVSTYAIKPFLMPDLKSVWRCFNQAKELGLKISVCSAFESGYSLSWLVLFAAMCNSEPVAAGLSTYRWFARDVINPSFKPIKGNVSVSTAIASIKNFDYFSYKSNIFL